MEQFFGIRHSRKNFTGLPQCKELNETVANKVVAFAQTNYSFYHDTVLYDLTTLNFETFDKDCLRTNDISKDNRSQQPQILIAVMVTKEGFLIA